MDLAKGGVGSISNREEKKLPEFEEIVRDYGDDLHRMARSLIPNREDAEDVLQETFLAIHQNRDRFEGRSSLKTWLVGILLKKVAGHRRRWSLRRLLPLQMFGGESGASASHPVSENPRRALETRLDIAAALERLPFKLREVFLLREVMGFSYSEIGEVLRIPIGTVESRVFRARREMRSLLEDYSEKEKTDGG